MSPRLSSMAVLLAAAAHASEWEKSFPPDFVCTQIPPGARTFLVAAAGQPVAEVKEAAAALSKAVNTCRRVTMVMDDAALGDLSRASDADVVAKAQSVPINIVVVVRLASSAAEAPPVSVVTMMNRQGEPRGGFSAPKGSPPAPPEPVQEAPPPPPPPKPRVEEPSPIPMEEAPAPAPKPKKVEPPPPPPPPEDPQVLYAQRSLHFENDPRNERTDGDPSRVLMGASTRPLSGAAFYNAVGRRDLANSYGNRSTGKFLAGLGGLAVMAGAGAAWYVASTSRCVKGEFSFGNLIPDTCLQHELPDMTIPAIGGGVVGLGLLMWGIFASPHPVDGAEARRLVDEYNAKLRKDLGLTTSSQAETPEPEKVKVALVPTAGPGGAGLLLVGQF